MEDFSARILEYPVRASAVDTFLRELRFRRLANLSALEAAVNDRRLSNDLVEGWVAHGWVRRAPSTPMYVFAGEELPEDLTLAAFCGEASIPSDENPVPPAV